MNVGSPSSMLSTDAWIERVISSIDNKVQSPLGELLPDFPDATLQANTTSLSGEATIRQAGAFYSDVVSVLEAAGSPLGNGQTVLDFGCGWGRIGRMFLRDTSIHCLHGIDVDPEFIAICREHFRTDNFHACGAWPPSRQLGGACDLIVSYSVFSHLSEKAVSAWLSEFHRLLKPRGFVAFTTRHASFFDYIDWARQSLDASPYALALGKLFEDTSAARALLAQGQLVHATSLGVSGGGVRDESFYGETWIPEQYLTREFGDLFDHVATCFNPERYGQVLYVLRKRG